MFKLTTSIALTVTILTVTIVCLAFGRGYCQPANPQDTRPEILETFVKELAERGQFNGAILIAEKGEVIYERAIGQRSALSGDTLGLGSQFRLASASMPFTALAVMQLEEAGLLSYEDSVEKYIPEWPYKGATIRNLLNETSGFPGVRPFLDKHWKPDLKQDDPDRIVGSNEHMIQMFTEHAPEPRADPGEKHGHTGTDYILLASIVERVSGLAYHQYMREKVFLPAGMVDTYSFSPLREDPLKNRAYGIMVSLDGMGLTTRDFEYLQALDGFGIYSTLRDLYRWDRALYTEKLVSRSSLESAFTPGTLNNGESTNAGFGWSLRGASASADGYAAGFGIWIKRDLEEQNTIIILTNYNLYLWAGVIQGVRHILQGEDYSLPKWDGTALVGQTLLTKGVEAARAQYLDFKNRPDEYELGGVMGLEALGHFLLLAGHKPEALFVFRLNTEEYPGIAPVWNRLADEYLSLGDTVNSVASYQKALALDKNSKHALEALQRLGKR